MLADGQTRGMKVVDPKACIVLLHNAEKAASVEGEICALHALLQGPQKAYAGILILHSNGIEARLIILSVGCVVLENSEWFQGLLREIVFHVNRSWSEPSAVALPP